MVYTIGMVKIESNIQEDAGLGNVIKLLRVSRGLSQQQLSALAQVTEMQISRIERNHKVEDGTLNRILKVLN